ncbi:hypothetical protein [Maridesulfovibrio sp.]|uniref:hypothetical protein n=1 Tax=Maridesulfovibrio sp. TaxID=2795000 RepID=UPI0039F12F14
MPKATVIPFQQIFTATSKSLGKAVRDFGELLETKHLGEQHVLVAAAHNLGLQQKTPAYRVSCVSQIDLNRIITVTKN